MAFFRRALIVTHRWLGIAGSALFIAWFASGIAMMYARMPHLTADERLTRLPPLDLATARVGPDEAARTAGGRPSRLRIAMSEGRPVYRFLVGANWTTVFADTGEAAPPLDEARAVRVASAFLDVSADRLRHAGVVREPDQWTLQIRGMLPAHRIAVGDAAASYLYISELTAEPVLITSRSSRAWGYASAVVHWIYFTPLRRNGTLWAQVVIWSSIAGCVLCLSGLIWGVWQFVRLRGTPYTGLMRWHHYAGLVFGAVTFTFVFSGLLSMDPWAWSPGTAPTRAQHDAVTGGPVTFESLTLPRLQEVAAALRRELAVKEIEVLRFRGELFAEAYRAPASGEEVDSSLSDPGAVLSARWPLEHRLVSVEAVERGAFGRFDDRAVLEAARAAMPGVPEQDATWLDDYDAYYYDRDRRLPLPVLRVRYDDRPRTWLYLDPYRGSIIRKEERLSRLNRWLYHGLHSLDFPWLYRRRPLWDIVVIALSLGGLFVSVSSAPSGWRRIIRAFGRRRGL